MDPVETEVCFRQNSLTVRRKEEDLPQVSMGSLRSRPGEEADGSRSCRQFWKGLKTVCQPGQSGNSPGSP